MERTNCDFVDMFGIRVIYNVDTRVTHFKVKKLPLPKVLLGALPPLVNLVGDIHILRHFILILRENGNNNNVDILYIFH